MKVESCRYEWLELWPRDLIFEGSHFVLLLENEEKELLMPVRFSIQSAELLGVANVASLWKTSLQFTVEDLFAQWDIELIRCTFVEHRLGNHKVKVFYSKDGQTYFIEKDLGTVLGLCLEANIPFYATKTYLKEVRDSQSDNEIFLLNQKWSDARQKYLM